MKSWSGSPLTILDISGLGDENLMPVFFLVRLGEYCQHGIGKHGVAEIFDIDTEVGKKIYAPCL